MADNKRKRPPARTLESRENQMIDYAIDLAEKQLLEGTASSQVIVPYLRLAAAKEKSKIELEILEKQKDLITAKTEALKSAQRVEELYKDALDAMKRYSPRNNE
jgi:hypothetical protein